MARKKENVHDKGNKFDKNNELKSELKTSNENKHKKPC